MNTNTNCVIFLREKIAPKAYNFYRQIQQYTVCVFKEMTFSMKTIEPYTIMLICFYFKLAYTLYLIGSFPLTMTKQFCCKQSPFSPTSFVSSMTSGKRAMRGQTIKLEGLEKIVQNT